MFSGKQFDDIGAAKFVERFLREKKKKSHFASHSHSRFGEGASAKAGVAVCFTSNGRDISTFCSSISGTLVSPDRPGYGWDSIFRLDEFGMTLSQISDVNLKDFISFRRLYEKKKGKCSSF